ncbi:hypothetical protein A3Q56_07620 [Intoshia linei]|uniref:Uncharacterized protein n=1 Tax=Intoshia linei TaxID=1819745 RepID=A0A177ARM7_9BILA|nr:hypothetical protein A3Q56_07620 [Intoshia linei]
MSETIHAKPKLKQLITTLCISAVNRNSITPIPDLRPSLSNYGIVNNIKVIEGNVFAYMANEFECLKVIKALDKSRLGGLEIEMAFAFHRSQQHSMFLRKHNPDFLKLCAEHIDMKLKYKILKRKELEGALPSIDDLVNEHFNKKSKSVCFDNFECVLVSIGPDTRDYELAMIKNIKTIGIKYTVEHINNDASLITNLIDEAVRSSVHFVIAIDKNNENFKSMTLYLLSKEQRQDRMDEMRCNIIMSILVR